MIREQKFSASVLTDESTGVELGSMLSANYLVQGSISTYSESSMWQ